MGVASEPANEDTKASALWKRTPWGGGGRVIERGVWGREREIKIIKGDI